MFAKMGRRRLAMLVATLALLIQSAAATRRPCSPCGNITVPYPLSTSTECGHPLYSITCSVNKSLQINAISGNYTVKSIDPQTMSLIVETSAFLPNTCITVDSAVAHNVSFLPTGPFFVSGNNTIMLLNATETLKYSPMQCMEFSPCAYAQNYTAPPSCHGLFCCSFSTNSAAVFKHGWPVYGQESGYLVAVNLPPTLAVMSNVTALRDADPAKWVYGLQLQWEIPQPPPCGSQLDCGGNSTCSGDQKKKFCFCNKGYFWDPYTGTCPKAPYCLRKRDSIKCHVAEYTSGLSIGIIGTIVLSAMTIYIFRRRKAEQKARAKLVKERSLLLAANSGGKSARLFSNKEMKRATHGFARERVLGCGGFGEVYKGILDDGTVVAIKSAKIGNVKGIDQVLNEVKVLSQVNHRSLVRLLGCCVDSELPLLVYEYVPNGNLYEHLTTDGYGQSSLDWRARLSIALQSAEGLAYLHSSAYPPIYHRDVKSSNILLDKSLNAKVADFGLSRLAEPDLSHVSTCAQGTLGYLDPEYYRNYQLTDKSDVYSYGVVLLELVSSQKAIDFGRHPDEVNLAVMAQFREEEDRIDDLFDPRLSRGASKAVLASMRSVVALALECLRENRLDRPSMKHVAETLEVIISSLEDVGY